MIRLLDILIIIGGEILSWSFNRVNGLKNAKNNDFTPHRSSENSPENICSSAVY